MDGFGNTTTKLYKYGSNESGSGTLQFYPDTTHFIFQNLNYDISPGNFDNPNLYPNYWRSRTFSSNLNPIFSEAYSYPVYYPQVTEYQTALNNANNGKTVTYYQLPPTTTYDVYAPKDYDIDYVSFNPRIFISSSEATLLKKRCLQFY